jgi:hypothetical protein
MKKVIRLTESDLINIVKIVINESDETRINSPSATSHIKKLLGVKDLSSGKYFYQPTTSREHGGKALRIKHPTDNKLQTDIINMIQNKSGIPFGEGKWSINGTYITFKK